MTGEGIDIQYGFSQIGLVHDYGLVEADLCTEIVV